MLSYWPVTLVALIVGGILVYLYRAELEALLPRPKQRSDDGDLLKKVAAGWKQTGYIDFSESTQFPASSKQPAEQQLFYLTVEEYRLIHTIRGGTAVERRWRRGSLVDARQVIENYYDFLREHPERAFNEGPRTRMTVRSHEAETSVAPDNGRGVTVMPARSFAREQRESPIPR